MLYIDDQFPTHPKIFKAGARLGANGPAQAIALYLAGLAYARINLTDGFVPDAFVGSCGLVQTPQSIASALSSRGVRLWHRVPGGYRIHDYHAFNPKASAVKEKREKERVRKAAFRAGRRPVSPADVRTLSRADGQRDSRARGTHVPSTGGRRTHSVRDPYEVLVTGRCASGTLTTTENGHAEIDRLAPGVRDRARANYATAADVGRRMGRGDQAADRRAPRRDAGAARPDGGDSRRRGGAPTDGHAAAAAGPLPGAAPAAVTGAAAADSPTRAGGIHVDRGARRRLGRAA